MILASAHREPVTVAVRQNGRLLLNAYRADTFMTRLRGLHAVPALALNEALIIRPCQSIQTFGMASALDVVFLDASGTVLRIQTVQPRRVAWCSGARTVVEMTSGTARRLGLSVGQVLEESDL